MPAPSEPETGPQLREEVVLKLGDILPRVPVHLLRPGPHDGSAKVRFSVDELAQKISRGRVSVPLERLASVCPGVFRDADAFPGEQEIQLPLQKLLEQVGLIAPKAPAANGVPGEQVAQARSQAGRIVSAAAAAPAPSPTPVSAPTPTRPAAAPAAETASVSAPVVAPDPAPALVAASAAPADPVPAAPPAGGIAKSISSVILSLFGRSGDAVPAAPAAEEPASPKGAAPSEPAQGQQAPAPEPAKPAAAAAPPAVQPIPPGCISLRVLPIFRLLSSDVLRRGALPPPADARVNLPLAGIEPQLAEGHVEVPIEEFIKALPENLRGSLSSAPGVTVWIPLDEIFQSLPPDHLFYMPPLDLIPEPAVPPAPEPAAVEPADEKEEAAPAEPPPAEPAVPPPAPSADPSPDSPAVPPPAPPAEPGAAEGLPVEPSATAGLVPAPSADPSPDSPAVPPPAVSAEPTPPPPAMPPPAPPAEPAPPPAPPAESVAAEAAPMEPSAAAEPIPVASAEPAPASPPLSRAPWMRGFQVPPPRLFSAGAPAAEPAAEPAPAPPAAPTPEARQTVDFLASQPGVFAAAAFVEGAVFASSEFPRKPDLDALRDFMGIFVERARESGKRLGWNHILTIGCDQFHLTAVVRESHFIVALHHERMLISSVHDSLIRAANDLALPPKPPG